MYEVSSRVSLYAEIQRAQQYSLPTVVFISGYRDSSSIWSEVQPEIAKHTLTVSYDRAGLGLSGETNKDKTTKQQVKELHKLLRKANIPGPYLLVGHSIGGLNVRAFADRYNNEVAGAVLIDSSHENQQSFQQRNMEWGLRWKRCGQKCNKIWLLYPINRITSSLRVQVITCI